MNTNPQRAADWLRFPLLIALIWLLPAAGGRDLVPRGMKVVPHTVVLEPTPEFADHSFATSFGRYRSDVVAVEAGLGFHVYGKYLSNLVIMPPGTGLPNVEKPRQKDLPEGSITVELPFRMNNTVAEGSDVEGFLTRVKVVMKAEGPAVEVVEQKTLTPTSGGGSNPTAPMVLLAVVAAAILLGVVAGFRRRSAV